MHSGREVTTECPVDEISAYIDGELDVLREMQLEAHFAQCRECAASLNAQKQFLCELDLRLRDQDEIEVPKDFAKRVVVTAESSVTGLRPPNELYNAIFICFGLLLFALFALGAESGKLVLVLETVAAAGGFLGHLVYSLFVGVVVILRSFAAQFQSVDMLGLAIAGFFFLAIALIFRRFIKAVGV